MNTNAMIKSRGYTLVLSLFFITLVTMAGLFLSRSGTMELRMAGNAAAKVMSFENAEDARLDAEVTLINVSDLISGGTEYDCGDLGVGYYAANGNGTGCVAVDIDALDWDEADSLANATNENARFIVEYMGIDQITEEGNDVEMGELVEMDVHVFRVIGQGTEPTGANSTIETVFLVRRA